jgi:ATP-dependent Clp protease adapter protein ClpS
MAGTDIQLDEKIKVTVQEPKRWKVILLNDDAKKGLTVASVSPF